MSEHRVKIQLEGPGVDGIWVTFWPIENYVPGQQHYGVISAAGKAMSFFIANIVKDEDILNEKLAEGES